MQQIYATWQEINFFFNLKHKSSEKNLGDQVTLNLLVFLGTKKKYRDLRILQELNYADLRLTYTSTLCYNMCFSTIYEQYQGTKCDSLTKQFIVISINIDTWATCFESY